MAPDVSGGERNPPSTGKSKHVLKKGPWTTSEDMLLVEYVKKHGEGNWNAVQRNSGLMRCGKSCRLRWANHLRPNLKKGAFTPDEEKLIVELHARLGNKWARMAAQLPGRTDNEIKNYWNTRLKRRQRAGLPIYPYQALKQEHHHHLQNSSSPSPPLLSSRLASSRPSNPNHSIFYNAFTPPPLIISPSHNQSKLYGANGGPSNLFFNMGIPNPMPMTSSLRYNALDYVGTDMGVLGLPSIQSPAVTPAASSSDFVVGTTSGEDYEVDRGLGGRSKSGLLEDLLGESRALACPEKTEEPFVAADERVHEKGEAFGFEHGDVSIDNKYEDLETKASEDGNNVIDDDLLHLLDNFPLSVPIPNWEEAHSSESSILSNGTNSVIESQRNISRYNTVVTSISAANQDWNFGSCLWNNMPSIY